MNQKKINPKTMILPFIIAVIFVIVIYYIGSDVSSALGGK